MVSEQHHGLVVRPFDTDYVIIKFALVVSSLHLFVLFHLRHVNSIATSCTKVIQSIIMQLLNQDGAVEKVIKKHMTIGIFQDLAYVQYHPRTYIQFPFLLLPLVQYYMIGVTCFNITSLPIFKAPLNRGFNVSYSIYL